MFMLRHHAGLFFPAVLFFAMLNPGPSAATDLPDRVRKAIASDPECRDYDANHLRSARQVAQLSENHTLYLLPCFTGAYNIIYRVYVVDKRYPEEVRPSLFATYADEMGWYGQNQLINAEFDPKTETLTAFEKGRGLGDCGSIPTYRWNEYGWRMIEYRYWGKCDGSRMPGDWPVIFDFKRGTTAR